MTTDPFTTAARAEAEGKFPPPPESAVIYPLSAVRSHSRGAFLAGAEWARDHLAAQEPTDAECIAVLNAVTVPLGNKPRTDAEWMQAAIIRCREAMVNARAAAKEAGR